MNNGNDLNLHSTTKLSGWLETDGFEGSVVVYFGFYLGVYFHFKTVDLSSFKFHHFICTRQNILDKLACDLIFPLRTMVTCISCLTSISVGIYLVLI